MFTHVNSSVKATWCLESRAHGSAPSVPIDGYFGKEIDIMSSDDLAPGVPKS